VDCEDLQLLYANPTLGKGRSTQRRQAPLLIVIPIAAVGLAFGAMNETKRVGWVGRAWILSIFGYSALRALVVWPTLGTYGINPWIFLLIDVGTAWPYAYGQVRVISSARARDWRSVQLWSLIAVVSFVAPYAYIAGAGSGEMPLIAWIIIGALMVFFGVASLVRMLRQIRNI